MSSRTRTRLLAGILVILGLIIMVGSAIAEFISPRDAFLASEILGLALSQIGIVLWSASTVSSKVRGSRDLILSEGDKGWEVEARGQNRRLSYEL